jgi:hypothetical protein
MHVRMLFREHVNVSNEQVNMNKFFLEYYLTHGIKYCGRGGIFFHVFMDK